MKQSQKVSEQLRGAKAKNKRRFMRIRLAHWVWITPTVALAVSTLFLFRFYLEFKALAGKFDLQDLGQMESAALVYDRGGELLGRFFTHDRDPVSYRHISKSMLEAVVAAEDQRFWSHNGVDYLGVARAALANWSAGRIRQGASTITQQLARNSFELKERTYRRKMLEIVLALRIEEHLSKEEIIEHYLNRVYFGGGLYGVEAASRGYFGVTASQLNMAQAATLAGLLKSPNSLSPWSDPEGAKLSRNQVLSRMQHLGMLSADEFNRYKSEELIIRQRPEPTVQSYPLDYVRQQVISILGYERAMKGGIHVHTSLDSRLQKTAEAALQEQLLTIENREGYTHPKYADFTRRANRLTRLPTSKSQLPLPQYLQGAALVLDNSNGAILAMVGGRDFSHSEYNRCVQGRRPLGTAFVPFVFAAAFDSGLFPGDTIQDWALDNRLVGIGGNAGVLGEWGVEIPDNTYEGEITLREALSKGKNSASARVGFKIGLDPLSELSKRAGIQSPLRPYANSYLGSSEMTLGEVTLAYTTFPGGGSRPAQIRIVDYITDASGNIIHENQAQQVKVTTNSSAWQIHSILTDSVVSGTGSPATQKFGLNNRVAGKTGTSYNFTDTWFFGYSSAITCGVWVGFDQPKQIFRGAFGRDLALPIWAKVMKSAQENYPPAPLKAPPTVEQIEICRESGGRATEECAQHKNESGEPTVYSEYYRTGQLERFPCYLHGVETRSFVKEYETAEWPKAGPIVNLDSVPPIEIVSSPVVGSDPYRSIATTSFVESDIPIAEAVMAESGKPTPSTANNEE